MATFIIGGILLLIAALAVWAIRSNRKKGGCAGGCAGCGGCCHPHPGADSTSPPSKSDAH